MVSPTLVKPLVFSLNGHNVGYFQTSDQSCIPHIQQDHTLAYIYSGKLTVCDGGANVEGFSGDCIFIRKNHRIKLSVEDTGNERIQILFILLNRNVLINFYQKLTKDILSGSDVAFKHSFMKLPQRSDIQSLFFSFVPYLNSLEHPIKGVLEIKLNEALYVLLTNIKGSEGALFDFASPWKIDILDFMTNNFMYNLSLKEMASYTGRSISAFKRDFKEVSELTPQRWITKKRLEAARLSLNEGEKISEVYLNLGFNSLSHFSTAYKKEYGISPSRNLGTKNSLVPNGSKE